jgi:NTP pyrophosphatase (non-canonical NTP hydrolase)
MDTFKEYQTIATSIPISLRNNRDRILLPVTALQQEAGKIGAVFARALDAQHGGLTPEQSRELKERMGDVLWCIAMLSAEIKVPLQEIAEESAKLLQARRAELGQDQR